MSNKENIVATGTIEYTVKWEDDTIELKCNEEHLCVVSWYVEMPVGYLVYDSEPNSKSEWVSVLSEARARCEELAKQFIEKLKA